MKKIISIWDKIELSVAGIAIGGALVICFIEVINRYVFGASFYWAKEYILYFVVWSVFLGASQVLKRSGHVRLELFINMLPEKGRKYLDLVTTAMIFVFGLLFFISGMTLVTDSYTHSYVSTSLAKTPIWIPQLIAPLSGLLFMVRSVEIFLAKTRGGQRR